MTSNITFLSLLLFSMRQSRHGADNTWLNCSFFTLITYRDEVASNGMWIYIFRNLHHAFNWAKR